MLEHQRTAISLREVKAALGLTYGDLYRHWTGTPVKPKHFENLIRYGHKQDFKMNTKRAEELAVLLQQLIDEKKAKEAAQAKALPLPTSRPFFSPQFIAEAEAHGVIGLLFSLDAFKASSR
jgi:hypothetical protein